MAPNLPQPLTPDELDRLADLLGALPDAMNLEMLDGFFAALVSGPELIMPNEYLPFVWGSDEPPFSDAGHARELMTLLTRHWNTIAGELAKALGEDRVYWPLLIEDDEGHTPGNDWARGFVEGMDLREGSWDALLDDDEQAGFVVPMLALNYEHDPDPELRPDPIDAAQRRELLADMAAGLVMAYRYFEPLRRGAAAGSGPRPATVKRETPKVGRNDPCPCGSGRKFKHCCGRATA